MNLSFNEAGYRFRDAMAEAGLVTDDEIYPSGRIRRFHVEGDKRGRRNGWYVLFAGRVAAGRFGCWKRGISERWCERPLRTLPPRDRDIARQQMQIARELAEQELANRRAGAAEKARRDWTRAALAHPEHPYLVEKQIGAYGIRQSGDRLLVPLWGLDRDLHGVQQIFPDGRKWFPPGTATKGHFHVVGDLSKPGRAWLAEGYATAASVHEHYSEPCVVAFNSGNLPAVAEKVCHAWSGLEWVVMADNDHRTPGNPGIEAGRKCHEMGAGRVEFPVFSEEEKALGLTDWNDLIRSRGWRHGRR